MRIDVRVPDGQSGIWKVETFEVPKDDLSQKISFFKTGRGVPPGTYKRLTRNGTVVMSNTPDEISDFLRFASRAKGSVLINGLGLGVLLEYLLTKEDVTDITVVELSSDVINLSGPTYMEDPRVTIINDNCFKYQPPKGKRYNAVWHDIWDHITSDNLPEMQTLHRKYGRRADYQESWCRWQCERQRKNDNF